MVVFHPYFVIFLTVALLWLKIKPIWIKFSSFSVKKKSEDEFNNKPQCTQSFIMIQKLLLLLFALSLTFTTFGQEKKPISHNDYDLWKRVTNPQISKGGDIVFASVRTATGRGDGYLKIYNAKTGRFYQFFNGVNAKLSSDGNFIVFVQKPGYQKTRQEKKNEVKKDDRTKDKLYIFDNNKGVLIDSVERVKSYHLPKKHTSYLVIEKHKAVKVGKDSTKIEKSKDTTAVKDPIYKADFALVYNLKTKQSDTIRELKDITMADDELGLYYSKTRGKKEGDIGVFEYDFSQKTEVVIDTGKYAYDKLTTDKKGRYLAYIAAKDSVETDSLSYQLYLYNKDKLVQLTDSLGKNLQEDWQLSAAQKPYFSEHAKRLYYYSKPRVKYHIDTTLLEDEVPQVDVWNYKDKLIQPEQKSKFKQLEDKAYLSYINMTDLKPVHLHDKTVEFVLLDRDREQQFILGYTGSPYDVSRSWDYPWLRDYYSINTLTGDKKLALQGVAAFPYLAPNGENALYFNTANQNWWSLNLNDTTKINLTKTLSVPFYDVENDVPADAGAYGFGGFDKDGNALVFDQFDIWRLDMSGKKAPINITVDGRKNNLEYRTLELDDEDRNAASYFKNQLLVTAFDKTDKTEKLFTVHPKRLKKKLLIDPGKMTLSGFEKAKNANVLLYRKQNFQHYPDLYRYNGKPSETVQITNANPQQKDFLWGTSELYKWTAFDGTPLEGILYKPENFDPDKKYPMIIYFYERRSDNLNRYYSPQPSASTVNMSYLVSNGYLAFVPDIVYKEGQPGQSAYNSIVSGAESLKKLPYVDGKNIGIQGQSWGGYQVAYLVTKTNMFKAAMAGAPVSNMTSAYGGIRWQSGLSRAFQYEKTQSRIGKNLWEGLDLYLENSPLFGIPNIETPLLMMHNDADGAVPYYQGIEMFMGMRRLGKPVWLLVYNDEAHNLRKVKNKQDLSIRMMQFFDHYLKGKPAPKWMTEGVPAVQKGKDFGYELEGN